MNLSLHPKLKRYLNITAKNAVFAVLTNSALMLQWHSIFNFDNWPGVYAVFRATVSVIASRELLVWLPKILKWSQTDADPNVQEALQEAKTKTVEAEQAIDKAKDAANKPGA